MASQGGVPSPRPIKTSQIKSRILNVATPNNYIVRLTPPGAVLGFMEERNLTPLQREDIELRCIRTSTPGSSFLTHSVANDYQGIVEEIPYRRAYETSIEMTFIVDNNYDTVAFFEAWMDFMSGLGSTATRDEYRDNPGANYRMNYYGGTGGYKTNIYLVKFEKDVSNLENIKESRDNEKALQYTLIDAYPKQLNSMELNYGPAEDFLRLTVTFGYSRYVRERVSINDQ